MGLGEDSAVPVPCHLLREVITDGCCPMHLRLQLAQLLAQAGEEPAAPSQHVRDQAAPCGEARFCIEASGPLASLDRRCLANVASYLPLAEVLSVRTCSHESLQTAMQREAAEHGPRHWVHDRIRTRLWMRRIADLTHGTKDESVFETQMRSLADEALRSRMETEMQEALTHMEEQIRTFQAEVDRRLEEQEQHVRRLVEERVQQELDTILASEVVKVQKMVEERVRERVSAIFRREVRETVRELQAKLDALVEENKLLQDAFAEANLRAKTLFWATHPQPLLQTAMTGTGLGLGAEEVLFSLKRRAALACTSWPGRA
mmetsp:Transcript_80277/g.178166  ORF Transcript_80277/g.178166 Transcript_80277/m.178166 type:complete len:318 (-) Transcript_80277:15-968(-)